VNTIECVSCQEVFNLKEIRLVRVVAIDSIIREELFLNDEEKSLKSKLIESFSKLNRLNQEHEISKDTFRQFELESHEHFQEIRRQIDMHREDDKFNAESRSNIDTIALDMIKRTQDFERNYFKCLDELVKKNLLFEVASIDVNKETQTLNELYRDPHLKIETIKKMNAEINEKIRKVQQRHNELISIRDHLKSNNFQPNEQETFGVLILNEFTNDLAFSSILSQVQSNELIRLCEFSFKDKFSLLYKGSQDGFGVEDFHSKCDGHENTLTILKAQESSFIFGGFATAEWESLDGEYKSDRNAFIFSLTNNDNQPVKMNIDMEYSFHAIYCKSSNGPRFAEDICIFNNANTTMYGRSDLGSSYKHPQYAYGTDEARSFLAGSFRFQFDEIEVYQKE